MKNVFVTGAGGFIGRHLVAQLLAQGCNVTALMLPGEPVPHTWAGRVRTVTGDVRKLEAVAEEIGEVDTIFHLAAVVSDWGSRQEHVDITVHGTEQAILLALKWNARFVVTTSIAAFASAMGGGKLSEATPRGIPASSYEYAKQLQEDVTLQAVREQGLRAVIIRPANVYGVGSVWVNRFREFLAEKKPALMGTGEWDAGLVHVHNLVNALTLAGSREGIDSGEIFVISDGQGVTWKQYLNALSQTLSLPAPKSIPNVVARLLAPVLEFFGNLLGLKKAPPVTRLAYRLTGVESIFDASKAQQILGYQPTVTLDEAMQEIRQAYPQP
ncbi:NAD-dependent epimerase/dehydratase family protein [Microbulbifer pacificus]|uniref:NAD-dependent epimerase/dehydratase family protein n=1 Tax=Microbulbifer pacificus TaxID=407164 RepID=A0AAU0MZ99_9GAMM|nr:NAD-dependent epimerase/dehydratase family protein [Microbulbifer pacificus]WOX05159.1 NAD-dependent epimerase/dehydratase family protein [Microbulbifer pacificus]